MRKCILLLVLLTACDLGNRSDPPKADDAKDMSSPGIVGATVVPTPVGAMLAFAGPTAPMGWWLCDGRAVSSDDYPELFKAIGSSWGDGGDGAGPLYNIPDMRGLFVRGVDSGAKRDPDAASRVPLTQGGNTGDRVGSMQDYATAPPRKDFQAVVSTTTTFFQAGRDLDEFVGGEPAKADLGIGGGDSETRPRNVGVNWIVKY